MAVENKYVDSTIEADGIASAPTTGRGEMFAGTITFEVAAADSDLSVYRLFKALSPDTRIIDIKINSDAITSGTDWDLGFYEVSAAGQTGAVVDKDALLDGLDLSSATVAGAEVSAFTAPNILNLVDPIYLLAGDTATTKKPAYDIALTANTVGSAAGTITVRIIFVQG